MTGQVRIHAIFFFFWLLPSCLRVQWNTGTGAGTWAAPPRLDAAAAVLVGRQAAAFKQGGIDTEHACRAASRGPCCTL